jgi:hypothetical protein
MGSRGRWLVLVVASMVASTVVSTFGASTVLACSCAAVDPVDAVGFADVVFTGRVMGNEGTENEPVWRFDVDGVVKGEVDPVEVVTGEDWAVGCGTDFGRFAQSVVVYAARSGDRLQAIGCMPTPTADAFAAQLAAIADPSGIGPPEAVVVGTVGLSDIALLDGAGRTITRADLGLTAGAVAHCPGTTRVAVVSQESSPSVTIVELSTLTAVEQRPIRSGFVGVTGDRVACFDGGDRIVTAAGYGADDGSVDIATSAADPEAGDVRRSFDDVSRAVIHPEGTVLLLPASVGDSIRTLSSTDLELIGDDFRLADGASSLDGDVSPDGSRLAVLVTLSGRPVEWDTGATHVVSVDLVDGVPVPNSAVTIELTSAGTDIESPSGAAKWIRWVDDDTWVIEYETVATKQAEIVATDGTQLLAPTDVGWGWGLVALDGGVLRARNGGVELLRRDGTSDLGDPAPSDAFLDRTLFLAGFVDLPPLELPTSRIEALSITPIEARPSGDRVVDVDDAPDLPAASAGSADEAGNDTNIVAWILVASIVLVGSVIATLTFVRGRSKQPGLPDRTEAG